MAEALGDGLADPVGLTDGLAVELAKPEGEALDELEGRAEPEGVTEADGVGLADGEAVADEVAEALGAGVKLDGSGVATSGAEDDAAASLGAPDAISPKRPLSAALKALLAMALGSDEAEALAEELPNADALTDALAGDVADGEADADALSLAVAEPDGDALADGDEDVLGDADPDALGEIVSDGDALADGDAPSSGRTMQGSRGEVTCSLKGVNVSAAIAAEPVPKVARIKLAETVSATPPERRTPRLRA